MIYKLKKYNKTDIVRHHLHMGGSNPSGESIEVNSLYFERGGRPWIGVMGEYHFNRDHRENWYRELCKMKAGGITIAATYLFWIYHEEREGVFDFSGDRDIRQFVLDAKRAGLDVVIRIGPWSHGECRNGGFPDWLLKKPYPLRDNNPEYLEKTRIWYEKIYEQVSDLFYRDGGNIIGIQFENELVDNAAHLAKLKEIALNIGYEAPLYTVTGWNSVHGAKIPVSEVVPVFAAYAEAPWETHQNPLPPVPHYAFSRIRNDAVIGKDLIKEADADGWQLPYEKYPFATCELGGGIHAAHHRRPMIQPMDIYALSLVKLGSGNNLIGYYMYHGGTNKIGALSTLHESRATGYQNDYTILSYDFQAPVSEYGEIRGHYRLLNLLHMFVNDFGDLLAPMEYVEAQTEIRADDLDSLRYAVRTDGEGGFLFVNHYQRQLKTKDVYGAVIDTGIVQFPAIDVCGDVSFIFPFHIDLSGNLLEYATAQLLCRVEEAASQSVRCEEERNAGGSDEYTYVFAAVDGIAAEYKFADGSVFRPAAGEIIQFHNIRIITLSWEQALCTRKLSGRLYVGDGCDLYECGGEICAACGGSFSYDLWNGEGFDHFTVKREFKKAELTLLPVEEPFAPPYPEELQLGGERKLTWKKLTVSCGEGMIEITDSFDVAQIYADGELAADMLYYGRPWRVPAGMLYGRECYLVYSEMRDDFYREF